MSTEDAILGVEVVKLGDFDDRSPWRITVDAWDGETIRRYQVTGHYNGWPEGPPERTLDDLARVQGDFDRRDTIAKELDRLDREAAAKIAPIMRELRREQVRVIYGDKGVEFMDRHSPESTPEGSSDGR